MFYQSVYDTRIYIGLFDYPMHAEFSIRVFTTQIYIGLFDYLCTVVHAERSIRAYLTVNGV